MEDRMDTSPLFEEENRPTVTFPVFGTVSHPFDADSAGDPMPEWLAKAAEGYTSKNLVKKLQHTKYDRVFHHVVKEGISNLMLNRYTQMILPSFQDDDIMELTLIAARLKTMGLNATAAALAGECGEFLDTKKVGQYFTNYSSEGRLEMKGMGRKDSSGLKREKINYVKPAYDPEHDPMIVQRKIQQMRLHGMARLRKGLMDMQKEMRKVGSHRNCQLSFHQNHKKSSASESSSPSPPRSLSRPTQLRFPSATTLRTDSKLDEYNIKRPYVDAPTDVPLDSAKLFKRSSVNEEILATKLEDSMSNDSDSEGQASVNSSQFNSPNVLPPGPIEQGEQAKQQEEQESSSRSTSSESGSSTDRSSSSSSGSEGKVEVKDGSESSVEEGHFEVVDAGSDSDGSISF